MKYREFKKYALGRMCTSCLNRQYGLNLKPEDCKRTEETDICYSCGKDRLIVEELKMKARIKVLTVKDSCHMKKENLIV